MSLEQQAGYLSLDDDINKAKNRPKETTQGVVSSVLPELTLEMEDGALIELAKQWEKQWQTVAPDLDKKRKENESYWLGKIRGLTDFAEIEQNLRGRAYVDNLIFEAVETYLPMATKKNPDPDVQADGSPEGSALAYAVQKFLSVLADRLSLKLTLKQMTRHWMLYYVGAIKVGWNLQTNEIETRVVRPQKLILDIDGTIERGDYTGEYVGEYREDKASDLVSRFPEKQEVIMKEAKQPGTKLRYVEWWTDDYIFWTLKETVLGKAKNPHWNYDSEEESVDEYGMPIMRPVMGKNHFSQPKKPFIFLSALNTGKRPFDDTSLVEQNLSSQDRVIKRLRQIDKNVDSMNGSLVVSEEHGFTQEQAGEVEEAIRRGGTIWAPRGAPGDAVARVAAPALPGDVYQDLLDIRRELKSNFGVLGSTAGGVEQEKTVRGKLIVKTQDGDRIGGGFSEYLEKAAEGVYNWWAQLAAVYYDERRYAEVIGAERAKEVVSLQSSDFGPKLTISVKEGSLVPQDSMSKRAEAIDLWTNNALDPISLYTALEMPNPRELAKTLYLWQTNPSALFPELAPVAPVMPGGPEGGPIATTPPESEAQNEADYVNQLAPSAQAAPLTPQ